MSFFKAILISFLIIFIMEKLYAFIKSRQGEVEITDKEESNFTPVTDGAVSLTNKPAKQIMAKTKKDKLSL